jgi:hypothetical protein
VFPLHTPSILHGQLLGAGSLLDEEVGWLMQKKIYIDHEEEGKVARRDLKLLQSNS